MIFNVLIFVLTFVLFTGRASAYIDPGTGSLIFQIIVGAILGSVFTVKLYFKKIKSFLSKIFKKDTQGDDK